MRSNEERVAAVKQRIDKIKQQKALRRSRIIAGVAVAASLGVIVGLSNCMPGIVDRIWPGEYGLTGMAASIFSSCAAVGYVVIALVAFLLGVCVTVLCYRIRLFHQNEEQSPEGQEGRNGRIC